MNWCLLSVLLSSIGFAKDFRPSEHFIYDFLIGPWRNISEEQIIQEVYPVATYSYLAHLVIIFLITDLCRYKPLIIILGISGIIIFAMLLWTTSLVELQIIEVIYGTLMATEIAYYTYIYAKVPKEKYQLVTGHVRAGVLVGRFLSGVVGQLLISFQVMDFRELTYISLCALIIATLLALFLPSVSQSIYFHHEEDDVKSFKEKWKFAFGLLWNHFSSSYSDSYVLKWSMWWAMALCGFILVQCYMQPLWYKINPDMGPGIYNGLVEAILTLFGTVAVLIAGSMKVDWTYKGESVLGICSLVEGSILIIASQLHNVYICYACYIVFGVIYHFMITVASAEVARNLLEDSYGLVFGFNTILSSILQTIIIVIFINILGFSPRAQYIVFGTYFLIIALVFITMAIKQCIRDS